MSLPAYDKTAVDLTAEEHKNAEKLYESIRTTQDRLQDGLGLDDLFALPALVEKVHGVISWLAQGDKEDPSDDAAVGVRIEAVGHALVRAGKFLQQQVP